ncbi:aryl-alcohol dehydrogenase-like predicted oxidoreductase [Pseudochelatococcus contaminans]|uniref:Aryl-alcohol dehydrogenase-like predicted oxidoreductase n=1 Tax=Pseudochelatococcus contaminans TaxID=1538103 RepID=A0A7W5Z3Q9_9HYPH|nr:aldo/keto reductase [Pseudochelatococcus contaminans]MBB3809041.1 aryl-alcohol dehydrogenase-like predicted oxidoreductase [Pseudochelatococcus contaminans]
MSIVYRKLGRTDLTIPSIALGTMTWGDQNTEAEGHAQLDYALERGINFLDTAEMYSTPPKAETQGNTERVIGTWLKARNNRDKVTIATKVIGRTQNTWYRDDGSTTELSRKQIFEAVDKSLQRLQTDYIDLYQLHFPDRPFAYFGSNHTIFRDTRGTVNEVPIDETLAALDEIVKAGKVRYVGLSNETPWGVSRFLNLSERHGQPRVQSIQNAYSLTNRTFEVGLAEFALREDVSLLAYSPLAQGYLTGKYRDGALPAGSRKQLYNRLNRYQTPGSEAAFNAYVDLAHELGLDPAQFAIAFVHTRPFVASVIIGASSLAQLEADIDAAEIAITPEIEERIDAIHLLNSNPTP